MDKTIVVIGGGPAGFFGAITAAETNPAARIILLEKHRSVLSKVRISGGGRCNVTHACFDPAVLVQNYPRGCKALRGPFMQFQPKDTIAWFEKRGVMLKTEEDGRMFPITDSSETIMQCLISEARKAGVDVRTECGVETIHKQAPHFILTLTTGETLNCDQIVIATGSTPKTYQWLKMLGHTITPLVPSLFTFNIPESPFHDLAGVSVPKAHLHIVDTKLSQTGPLLMTHWGLSGPAVLKLSAFGARILHDLHYQATVQINWVADGAFENTKTMLQEMRKRVPNRQISSEALFELPRNLWKRLLELAKIPEKHCFRDLSNKQIEEILAILHACRLKISGKTTYKDEFVTCGGVDLDEVNFKTMESRKCPGLYFAGEVLDIDGVTGGFNFQNAWTTGWIAGKNIGKSQMIVGKNAKLNTDQHR